MAPILIWVAETPGAAPGPDVGAVVDDDLAVDLAVVVVLAELPDEHPAAAATSPRISTYRQVDKRLRTFTLSPP